MDEEEFRKMKAKLMKPGWTEDLHHGLEELPIEDAKRIVESMSKSEIFIKVNNRKFQQDYIADYLEYLWDISEFAFWKQVKATFNLDEGILWSDNMTYFEKICKMPVPNDVLKSIVDFAVGCDANNKIDFEAIGCAVKAQAKKFNRLNEIKTYISQLDISKRVEADRRITDMVSCDCKYIFY